MADSGCCGRDCDCHSHVPEKTSVMEKIDWITVWVAVAITITIKIVIGKL